MVWAGAGTFPNFVQSGVWQIRNWCLRRRQRARRCRIQWANPHAHPDRRDIESVRSGGGGEIRTRGGAIAHFGVALPPDARAAEARSAGRLAWLRAADSPSLVVARLSRVGYHTATITAPGRAAMGRGTR